MRRGRPGGAGGRGGTRPENPFNPQSDMFKRNLWKIILSLVITGWAVSELLPLKDVPFPEYAKEHATAGTAEFSALLDKAAAR